MSFRQNVQKPFSGDCYVIQIYDIKLSFIFTLIITTKQKIQRVSFGSWEFYSL